MHIDPSTTKYVITARITADGVVEKPDVVGAIFGQTEGLLGEELDLRDLQKSGRIGRIEVKVETRKGKSEGEIIIPSSLDQIETSILAGALETIDRIGPCKAKIETEKIEDVRMAKRKKVIERAKTLVTSLLEETRTTGMSIVDSVRDAVHIEEIISYGPDKCPAGPNIDTSDAIIVVEGRSDVMNLLKCGIKNAIAVEGTNIPKTVQDLSKKKIVTVFVDGDRGGRLILKELSQTADIDFVAVAPQGSEVEELTFKQIMKALRDKVPFDQFVEMYNINLERVDEKKPLRVRPIKTQKTVGKTHHVQTQPTKELSEKQINYKQILSKLIGTSRVNILDGDEKIIVEMPVKELPGALRNIPKESTTMIFDGTITQRLVDYAADTNINTIVAKGIANVSKLPLNLNLLTKSDLE